MDWLFNPATRATPSTEIAPRNTIVRNFKEAYPGAGISYWARAEEPYLCDVLYRDGPGNERSYVFANPYTGEIQGESGVTFARFFRDFHYYLFIPFQVGNYLVLAFGFLLFISMATALLFYKRWWRKLFELQTGKGTLVLFRSLHRLIGLWSVPFSVLFSITGIWYFLERSNIADIGDISNPPYPEITTVDPEPSRENNASVTIDYDQAVAISEKEIAGLRVGSIVPSVSGDRPIYLTGYSEVPLVRERANRVYLHPRTYEVLHVQKAGEIPTVMWINDIADPLHFGTWGGLPTKILYFFFGLGISSLVLSGIWVTYKRKALKVKRKRQQVMGFWRYINWAVNLAILFFMYSLMITRYSMSAPIIIAISLGWVLCTLLGYYLFVYRLNRQVAKELAKNG